MLSNFTFIVLISCLLFISVMILDPQKYKGYDREGKI